MRRATGTFPPLPLRKEISIHALHEESDRWGGGYSPPMAFQSTLSMRRATYAARDYQHALEISIHALHEESDVSVSGNVTDSLISIHALHEESDRLIRNHRAVQAYFNPRSP